ncbi:MAG: response regulator [Kofleriaceae bacterium]|nr:response regulator [Kofleriaceae bacterium]
MNATDRTAHILNVNDREIPRYVNEELLRRVGFEVTSVATGEQALMVVDASVDLVLLDVQLPRLDSYEVCRRIKANPKTASVAVLLSSASCITTHNKVTGLDSGADGYLVQPFETTELVATIRALLRTRGAERRASALAEELGHAMEVRDEFLAMLGHELRNPIGAITTALHLIDGVNHPPSIERYVRILNRQTTSLSRIVDDLLDVARITHGKVQLDRRIVDLDEIVRRCGDVLGAELLGARHDVQLVVRSRSVLVDGDPVRLEQIITNLVTNGIKYTPSGGTVTVELTCADGLARLAVSDTGIGMDASTLSHVFDVFIQGKQGLDRSRGGLGLGLTVVRRLVELHGGSIRAHSDGEGTGSSFVVTLPVAVQPLHSITPGPLPTFGELANMRILIVEDNPDAREGLAELLSHRCRYVETAADGQVGLERALASPYDVMLIDVGLPVVDGYEVARRLRDRSPRPRLIAVTGYGQPDDRRRALAAGFDLHLVKPVSLRQLLSHLSSLSAVDMGRA